MSSTPDRPPHASPNWFETPTAQAAAEALGAARAALAPSTPASGESVAESTRADVEASAEASGRTSVAVQAAVVASPAASSAPETTQALPSLLRPPSGPPSRGASESGSATRSRHWTTSRSGLDRLHVGLHSCTLAELERWSAGRDSGRVALGTDRDGAPVQLRAFRPGGRTVLVGRPWAARVLIQRTLATGAAIVVVSAAPGRWEDFRRALGPAVLLRVATPDSVRSVLAGAPAATLVVDESGAPEILRAVGGRHLLTLLTDLGPDPLPDAGRVLLQRLSPADAAVVGTALRLDPRSVADLQRLGPGMLALLDEGNDRYLWLEADPDELSRAEGPALAPFEPGVREASWAPGPQRQQAEAPVAAGRSEAEKPASVVAPEPVKTARARPGPVQSPPARPEPRPAVSSSSLPSSTVPVSALPGLALGSANLAPTGSAPAPEPKPGPDDSQTAPAAKPGVLPSPPTVERERPARLASLTSGGRRSRVLLAVLAAVVVLVAVGTVGWIASRGGPPTPPPVAGSVQDDFSGSVLASRWVPYVKSMPNGSAMRSQQLTVSGGDLAIVGTGRSPSGAGDLTGGLCWCGGAGNRTYGTWEVRAQFAPGSGYVPEIGLWPADGGAGQILVVLSPTADRKGTYHSVTPPGNGKPAQEPGHVDASQWHDYRVEWRADSVRISIDGATVLQTTKVPTGPHFLYLQQDIGDGSTAPKPGPSTPDRVVMYVDRVSYTP